MTENERIDIERRIAYLRTKQNEDAAKREHVAAETNARIAAMESEIVELQKKLGAE
jgi:uncharacterized protein YceH (UPF0502 family)